MSTRRMIVEATFDTAPLERSARTVTVVALLLVVAASVVISLRYRGGIAVLVTGPALFAVIAIIPWIFAPSGYAVGSGHLAVLRHAAKPLLFPLGSLQAARPTAMPRSRRGWAVAGLYGWWGGYRNKDWGPFKVYATTRRRGVLLEWPGFRLFVSPQDREALCAASLAGAKAVRQRSPGDGRG